MNGQTIKLMRTNLMGSQQITFLYDLIYSYFPYYLKKKKKQSWNEDEIIQFIVSLYLRFMLYFKKNNKPERYVSPVRPASNFCIWLFLLR